MIIKIDNKNEYPTQTLELTPEEIDIITSEMAKAAQELSKHPKLQRIFEPGRCVKYPVTITVSKTVEVGK
ncbi:hypothetical protein D3C73_1573120 [compost metagenome]